MSRYYFRLLAIFAVCVATTVSSAQNFEHSQVIDPEFESESKGGEVLVHGNPNFSPSLPESILGEPGPDADRFRIDALDRVQSLEGFTRSQLVLAQNILRASIHDNPTGSYSRSESLLLSALELLSTIPLDHESMVKASRMMKEIPESTFAEEPAINAEYEFWLGELLHSEHDNAGAISSFTAALGCVDRGEFAELVRFRRAELFEHELHYLRAASEFDTVASHDDNSLRLIASLRRSSLLRTMKQYPELLREITRSATLASDTSRLRFAAFTRDIGYHSPYAEALAAPRLLSERILPSAPEAGKLPTSDSSFFASEFVGVEIQLLRGAAYSGMNQFDSAEECFLHGEKMLQALMALNTSRPEALYLSHALRFERGWISLFKGNNQQASEIFSALAKEDTVLDPNMLIANSSADNTGIFYRDEAGSTGAPRKNSDREQIDTSRFIYDDYPARSKFYSGIAYSRLGKAAQARDVLTNLSQDPTAIYAEKARYHLALVEFRSGRTLQAEGLLIPIAMRRSQSGVYASILLGDLHYRRSSFAKAAEYFAFALGNLPDNDSALRSFSALERGLSLLPLGSWNESAHDLKLYVSLANGRTQGLDEALFWLGRAYFRSDSIPQARNCFKRVLTEFPQSSRVIDAQYGYAWTLFRNGEYAESDREFAKVIEIDSITRYAYDALSRRGDALYAGGELRKAVAIYNLAVDRPTFNEYRTTRSLYQLGVIRMRCDSARSAMNAFHTIISKFPKSDILDRAYYNYAVAGFAIKLEDKASEAVRTLTSKFKESPFAPKGLCLAASDAEHRGDYRLAYSSYKKVILEYPTAAEFVPSLFGAIGTLVQQKKYDDAISLTDSFSLKNPTAEYAPRLLYRKGEIQLIASSSKKAEQTFKTFIERFPNDTLMPMAKYMLGKATSATDKEGAITIYRQVTDTYPHSSAAPLSYLALARLEKMNPEHAATDYTRAFDLEYYSSDAAPLAMLEYAGWVRSQFGADSALVIYNSIIERYFVETSIGGKAQLEVADILFAKSKKSEAVARLQSLAVAQEGYELAAEARLRLGQEFRREGSAKKALADFDRAREDNATTKDQLARSYLGSAECHIALGDKKSARQILGELLVTGGISRSRRDAAKEILASITPKKKPKKHK